MAVSWIQCIQLLQLFKITPVALTAYNYSVRHMLEFYWIFDVLLTLLAEQGFLFMQESVLGTHIKITLLLQRGFLNKLTLIDAKFYLCMVSISITAIKAFTAVAIFHSHSLVRIHSL